MRISANGYTASGQGMLGKARFQVHGIKGQTIILKLLDNELANGNLIRVEVKQGGETIQVQSYFGDMDEWQRVR